MAVYQLDGVSPQLADGLWLADSAQVMGNVALAEQANVWFGVVIRGDTAPIRIGRRTNIQDLSVLHASEGVPLTIGDDVTVGHRVVLHGCSVGDGSLIGIGSVVLNRAKIGKGCLVGAGALVTEGKQFPDHCLILGQPARAVRQLSPGQRLQLRRSAQHYVANAQRFRAGLQRLC